jgi:hypothetical protein
MTHFWAMKEYQVAGLRVRITRDNGNVPPSQRVRPGDILQAAFYDFDMGFLFVIARDGDTFPLMEEWEDTHWEIVR